VAVILVRVSLDEALVSSEERDANLETLDDALTALAAIDPRKSRVVELRFFGRLSIEETAQVLGVSDLTVSRDWKFVRLWLLREVSRAEKQDQKRS
jgi:RNA polymerase sigma factor (sigma-70 family)